MTGANLLLEGRLVACSVDANAAEVEFSTTCGSCRSRCLLGTDDARRLRIALPDGWRVNAGERLRVAVPRTELTRSCALIFGAPLGAWLGGTAFGSHYAGDAHGVLIGLATLACVLLIMCVWRRSLRRWLKIELIALRADPAPNKPGMRAALEPKASGLKYGA